MSPLVGDDVVDLDDPSIARSHPRYPERVCGEEERAMLAASREPVALLWTLFAAKEAAFKVAAKLGPAPPVFAHRAFVVARDLGTVRWEGLELALRVERGDGFVHAVATHGTEASVAGVERMPRGDQHASRRARALLASCVARRLGADVADLQVSRALRPGSWDGFAPPRLLFCGAPSGVDVSLSHDGRFVSFAACGPAHAKNG